MYIEFDSRGNIVVQDKANNRHKFLTPPAEKRNQQWESISDFMDFIYDQYEFVRWINDEGVTIKL